MLFPSYGESFDVIGKMVDCRVWTLDGETGRGIEE
jgi:hypothetical protein